MAFKFEDLVVWQKVLELINTRAMGYGPWSMVYGLKS